MKRLDGQGGWHVAEDSMVIALLFRIYGPSEEDRKKAASLTGEEVTGALKAEDFQNATEFPSAILHEIREDGYVIDGNDYAFPYIGVFIPKGDQA